MKTYCKNTLAKYSKIAATITPTTYIGKDYFECDRYRLKSLVLQSHIRDNKAQTKIPDNHNDDP